MRNGKTFGPDQIADLLNVAPRTVAKWIDDGLLAGYRLPGNKKPRRVTRENLVKFAKQNKLPLELP